MDVDDENLEIDHINHDRTDNRKRNLRIVHMPTIKKMYLQQTKRIQVEELEYHIEVTTKEKRTILGKQE